MTRSVASWLDAPLADFVRQARVGLAVALEPSGRVLAQHGFTRSLDVMAAAALGAGIIASTSEVARIMGSPQFGALVHQGGRQGVFLAGFETPRGRWIGLVVFGSDTSVGLVQLFFDRLARDLAAAAPAEVPRGPVLAENFERDLNASLHALFGR